MGGACTCGGRINDSLVFWSRLNIRKITFYEYLKLFEENKINWVKSACIENNFIIDISKCEKLNQLLDSPDFTEKERIFFLEKIKNFFSKQTDKLLFFTSLSFFTSIEDQNSKDQNKKKISKEEKEAKALIDELKNEPFKDNYDTIFDNLRKMAIKPHDHNDVTKTFIELVSEFTIDFLDIEPVIKKEKYSQYSQSIREKLFDRLQKKPKDKFYDYMFNIKNIKLITDDLNRIYLENLLGNRKNSDASYEKKK